MTTTTDIFPPITCSWCGYINEHPRKASPKYCPACKRLYQDTPEMIARKTQKKAEALDAINKIQTPDWVHLDCCKCGQPAELSYNDLQWCKLCLAEELARGPFS